MGNCSFKDKAINEVNKNHYDFQYVIGRGGFGKVWKVEKKNSKQSFALKEISKVKIYEKNSVPCVINERKLLAHLRHPYNNINKSFIINMHYAFQDKDNLFIVMDYLSGGDLRYHICKQKKFNEEQSSTNKLTLEFFIACLLLALEYLHFNNIIHRDIKPENLVFDHKGYLYLTDMGIAKLYRKDKTIVDSSGTPGYMSPEVIINQPHDLSSDFFAIGVMLHEFMFCKRPYVGKSRKEIKDQILAKEIVIKVSDVPPGWSIEAADLINRLLKRRAQQRLGKNGISEVKEHAWLKDINWAQLYKKELPAPFVPKFGDNFDKNYCNKEDPIDKNTYGLILNKVNQENSFQSFYFNYYDIKSRDVFFELDGLHYTFTNIHEEKQEKINTQRGPNNLSSSIGLKIYENSTSLTQNLNASFISPKKAVS